MLIRIHEADRMLIQLEYLYEFVQAVEQRNYEEIHAIVTTLRGQSREYEYVT